MKKYLILLIALFYGFIDYGQVAYGDITGTALSSDPDFQLSAAGLYFQRVFGGGTKSVRFSVDTVLGIRVSAAKDLSDEAVGVDFDTNATSTHLYYYSEIEGGALFMAQKQGVFNGIGGNMIAINAGLDTFAGFRAAQYSAQWVHRYGATEIIQTLPNHFGVNGQALVTDGAGNPDWQNISGTLPDTAFRVLPVDFVGDSFSNPLLVNRVPDNNVMVFSDEGTGGLLFENDGYTMNPLTGTITTSIGRYRILILR